MYINALHTIIQASELRDAIRKKTVDKNNQIKSGLEQC